MVSINLITDPSGASIHEVSFPKGTKPDPYVNLLGPLLNEYEEGDTVVRLYME